jgi:hypothetical protein
VRRLLHHAEDSSEQHEVGLLRGSQRVFFEERHHGCHQIRPSLHGEAEERLAVVVVSDVLDQLPAPEHLNKEFERRAGGRRLSHRELVLDLPAEPAARVAHYRDRKAALAVDEADSPLLDPWPFLLIVRTGRIFTPHCPTLLKGSDS